MALELLEAEGPEAVSTRKVAAAYGASTMAVYSEFGSLGGLVSSVVDQGFGMLSDSLRAVDGSDDPVADLVRSGMAYRAFARDHPDLYRVMYAVSPLAGHQRSGAELMQGADAFGAVHEVVRRAFRLGRAVHGTPYDATLQVWMALHGIVLLELAGYLDAMPAASEDPMASLVRNVLVGLGDLPARAEASVATAASGGERN
jgi:AcrR family transcriptional regulator